MLSERMIGRGCGCVTAGSAHHRHAMQRSSKESPRLNLPRERRAQVASLPAAAHFPDAVKFWGFAGGQCGSGVSPGRHPLRPPLLPRVSRRVADCAAAACGAGERTKWPHYALAHALACTSVFCEHHPDVSMVARLGSHVETPFNRHDLRPCAPMSLSLLDLPYVWQN